MTRMFQNTAIALTVSIVSLQLLAAYAAPGQTNSINNGRDIQGGTYYNTPGAKTTFQNTGSGGLWLRSGVTTRGLEVNNGQLTGNGGTLHFYAPNSMVRVDGSVNVNALTNGSGIYTGNGGKVLVDAGYFYQNGSILAGGVNGGQILMNVGAATMGPTASINAQGQGGYGGNVQINSEGPIDVKAGALVDTSGRVYASYNRNVIAIEGGVVNNAGVMRANGLTAAQSGGIVQLIANGNTNFNRGRTALQSASQGTNPTISPADANTLITRGNDLSINQNGRATNSGTLQANGTNTNAYNTRAGSGGLVNLEALKSTVNSGLMEANGGNSTGTYGYGGFGGNVEMHTNGSAVNNSSGVMAANGGFGSYQGGTGGTVVLDSLNTISNAGSLQAKGGNSNGYGGNGGTVAFVLGNSYQNNGTVNVNGGTGYNSSYNGRRGNFYLYY